MTWSRASPALFLTLGAFLRDAEVNSSGAEGSGVTRSGGEDGSAISVASSSLSTWSSTSLKCGDVCDLTFDVCMVGVWGEGGRGGRGRLGQCVIN